MQTEPSKPVRVEASDHDQRDGVDPRVIVVLIGMMMLISALAAYQLFDAQEQPQMLAMLAALLLGIPVTWDTVKSWVGPRSEGPAHTEELVMLAFWASFAASRYVEAGSIALFMFFAGLIVDRTAAGAHRSIEALVQLSPLRAVRLNDGVEEDASAQTLQSGDRVLVRPGDQVPGDGRVVSGFSSLDEQYITGEAHPVDKTIDDQVFAGSINLTGILEIEIEKPLDQSTLGKVQSLIVQATQYKTPVTQVLDRFAGYYTPVVLSIAGIVLFFTRDMSLVISLLLIACPMEIIISGPLAMVAALTAAARLGVLIKNAPDLEVAAKLSAIVFDKTGTLTTGNLAVTRLHPVAGTEPADLLRLAASLEQHSRHPVARAMVTMAKRARLKLLTIDDFEEVAGRGVRGNLNGRELLAGREAWIRECGVYIPGNLLDEVGSMSVLLLAEKGRCIGWVGLSDQKREGAGAILNDLKELGIRQRMMVTGDRIGPATHMAETLDLTGVVAEALPDDKLDIVRELKQRGHTVAVIGDGVNDGPALAAADLSIAMGAAGSDVAINAASIALMNSQLNRLPFLVRLSQATTRVIRQNIGFVMVYILTMVALLGLGFITPIVAALAHGVSSIVVVFNSARLIRQGEDLHMPGESLRNQADRTTKPATSVQSMPVVEDDSLAGRIAG